jgi:hypothetical protein
MKRIFLLTFAICIVISLTAKAQTYIDGGFGLGMAWHVENGQEITDRKFTIGTRDHTYEGRMAFDYGMRWGYKNWDSPLFFTVEFLRVHRSVELSVGEISQAVSYSHYFMGPGFVYYPMDTIQLASSVGISTGSRSFEYKDLTSESYNGNSIESGLGLNVSLAYDMPFDSRNGLLIGVRYFNAVNGKREAGYNLDTATVGLFVKYRFIN